MTSQNHTQANIVDASLAGKMCSICQTQLVPGEYYTQCPDCSLPFHVECWEENRGCAQYGCKSAPETVKPDALAEFQSSVWGDEKPCPACGKSIKAKAQKCRHCGAMFEERGFVSREQYAKREYQGKDYDIIRNKIFGLFLASITGILSPVSLIIFAILYTKKTVWGIDYQRLPPAFRAIVISGICMSGFLIFLLMVLILFDK